MPDPIYNPNNIVRKEKTNVNSDIPEYNPNNIVKKEVVDTRNFTEDANVAIPSYATPQEIEADSAINFLKEKGGRNGSTVLDSEWDVLKDVLKDTRATKEQREKAILTIQGYDAKHDDNNTMYYNKLEDNGVYVPTALAYGEKPPKGYKVASVWGNQKEAEDDSWYTDLGKSLGNGVMGAVQGVVDIAQVGTTLVTGEESSYLNKLGNTAEALKFKKDSELNTPIFNSEGIKEWSDLLDKDRFDLSAKSLWGTLNMAAESFTEFGLGAKGAGSLIQGVKGFRAGLKGIEEISELGKVGRNAAIFTGSFASMLGDNLEAAEAAGLKGRDKAAVATAITAPMAAIDAAFGLEGKVMDALFRKTKRELFQNLVSTVERDAVGNITEQGFRNLTKEMTVQYSQLAKNGLKNVAKDALREGTQEAAQDFVQKSGEQLWDKMTPDERGQFGSDALTPKAFGDYINSFAMGLVSGAPLSLGTQVLRNKHDEQSINAYERVKQGPEAIKALKVDLDNALKNNDINQPEYEQAMFKIDAYSKYNEETKGVNLKPENEKKAFELSFQIQGLKTEIPTNENEISKLDPIARAKVESKQKQAKELQSELNDIIRQGEIKGEPVIPKKEEERIQKEKEKEIKVEETNSKLSQEKEVEKAKTRQPDIEGLGKEKVITYPKLENKPYWKDDKRTYEEIDTEEFNNPSTDARTIHRVVRKEAYNKPNHKIFGNLTKRLYSYINDEGDRMKGDVIEVTMEDGKKIRVASSKQEFKDENDRAVRWDDIFRRYFRSERTQGNEEGLPVGIRAVDLNNPLNEDRGPDYKPGKIALKVFDARTGKFLSWAKETKTGSAESLDKAGNELYTAEQKDLLKTLEQQMYNENPEGGDVIERLTKPKPKPTPTEKAKVATEKIVEEGKAKVKEQKASVPLTITKAVKQQLYDLGYSKVNVDNMKPERALDIINKQETNKKEDEPTTTTPTDLEALKQTPADIERISKETEAKIKRKDLFIGVGDFSSELGGSDMAAVPVSHKEINGIEFVEYAHPKTGSIDVIVTGKSENDFVGFYRLYENGKPTNKWSSKFENQSRNKEDFKTMISGIQEMLPQGHEYTEKTSISTDGLRIWNQQLDRGYELQYDENGKLKTNLVAINGDAIVNDLGIDVNKGEFENIKVKSKEDFEKVKKALLPYLQKFGLNENNIKWIAGNIEITPTNEKAFGVTATVKIDLPILKSTKQVTEKTKPTEEKGKVVVKKAPKEPTAKKDSSSLRRKITGYNQLSSDDKKSDFGINLRKEIQKEVEEFGGSLKPLLKGKIQLLDSEGKQVKKAPIKREQSVIDAEKAIAKKRKDALSTNPTTPEQYIAMVIGSKGQFKESVVGEIPDVPSMMKDFKNGYTLESLYQGYQEKSGFYDINEDDFNSKANNFLSDYLTKGGRDLAIDYAVEAYEREINDGKTDKELADEIAYGESLGLTENEVVVIDESVQNLNEEEVTELETKIENTNEKDRNEESANKIIQNIAGEEGSNKSPFDEMESEQDSEEGKDIVEGKYPDDVFQKPAELQYAEGQLKKAEIELTASKKALDAKRKELDKGIVEDREDLFGERKSTDATSLFDERVDLNAREETLVPFKQRYENAQKDFAKQTAKVKELQDKGDAQTSLFQKKSVNKEVIDKVVDRIKKALPKVKVVYDEKLKAAGKWSPSTNTITINPFYAGKDTAIHEGGHILIDAMGYNNRIIQAAIKQLRNTPLYAETKQRYPELNEEQLDKEVLAEAIGREGADIFDKVEDRSKFKAYLDYIFDWLKQKLGLDKNVAKSLAKQIIGGVRTKELKGVATGKEQLQKDKKKPFAAQALKYNQYAMEEGFDAQKEFDKYEQATVELREVKEDEKLATIAADEAVTDEEIKTADAELEKQRALLKEASKEFAIKAKRYLGYLKYKKDFRAVQAILKDKDLDEYTENELNDLITKLFAFNDRAAKAVKERAYQRLGHLVTVKQNEIHKDKEGFIEALGKTSDISPLQSKILHYSQFSEKNADMQALALANGKAIIDKITEANSLKDTHAKLGLKVIQEENKRLGITGKAANRFSSDSSKYFEWMINEDGNYLTIDEAKAKGLSKAKLDYLDFHRETVAGYRESMSANDYENVKMGAIRVDKNFREAYKSEGLIPAFSYYLGGGATNLGRVRILHNGKVMSYSEIEKEIIAGVDKKNIKSIAKALYNLLVANIKARRQLKKGQNIDEKDNPLELKGDAEYSLNEKGQLVSKFDKPRAKDRGYSKDFYKAMNQFIDESAHVKHISKIMPLVEAIEYLNKYGYMEEGYVPKKNVSKWINDWKALQIFKEPYVNDPVIDAAVKSLRKLVASTTMWFNIPANAINVFVGNYNNWRAENAETLARGNARLFGGKGSRKKVGIVNDYALAIIKKYNLVNQDFDSHPVIKAGSIFSKLATFGTQVGEYQIQGSLALGLLSQEEFDSFEFTKDKYGNDVLTVKPNGKYTEDEIKSKMTQVKNRVTDIQGKYPDEDRRNIMRGEFGKALFQFKVWMPDWFKERFSARYFNAYGQEKEGSYTKMLRVGVKEMAADLKKGDIKKALTNPAFVQNLKGMATIGALLALKHGGDDDDDKKKGGLNWDSALSQVLFIFDLEQDKYMVSNPAAILGKIKDMLNAFEALVGFEEDAWQKTKRILPGGKAVTFVENQIK